MKKIIVLSLVLAAVAATGVFANGTSESKELAETWDTVTITGTVSFDDWPHPEITYRGTTYELIAPRFEAEDLEIKDGDEITIEGIVVERPESDATYLKVVRAVIDGEEYNVPFRGMPGARAGGMPGDGYGGREAPGLYDRQKQNRRF